MDKMNADNLSFFDIHPLQPPPLVNQIVEFRQQPYACIYQMDDSLTILDYLMPGTRVYQRRWNAIVHHTISRWAAFCLELPVSILVRVANSRIKGCFRTHARYPRREKRRRREENTGLH